MALCAAACADSGGSTRIVIDRADASLSAETGAAPLTEPHLAVSPTDASHLVVGAIVAPVDSTGPWHCAAFASWDGGESWLRRDIVMDRCIDPWVSFTPDGEVLLIAIELGSVALEDGGFRLLAFRSADGGRSWSDRAALGTGQEHAMTFAAPRGTGEMYMISRQMYRAAPNQRHDLAVRRSTDDGRTFGEGDALHPFDRGLTATGLAFAPDGGVAVGFHDFTLPGDGTADPEPRLRAWVYRSAPDGSFEPDPDLITDRCGTGGPASTFPGHPAFVGDGTGRLYHACVAEGLDAVLLTRSADAGVTWDAPVRIGAVEGDAPTMVGTPMLAVGPTGALGVAWYDRRHDPERACQDFYFTASIDHGRTFAAPVRVSSQTSCPQSAENGRAGRSWAFGGDYTSIAPYGEGFYLVWADSRAGRFALRRAVVSVEVR